MAATNDSRSAWIDSEEVSKKLNLFPRPPLASLPGRRFPVRNKPRALRSCCHLELTGQAIGQGIIAYCEDINQLILITNHHLIHSKASVTNWKISVGKLKGRPLCEEDFTTCVSCCGPDGLLGQDAHPRQESVCQFNADFTVLVISVEFAYELYKHNLNFPVISSDTRLLNAVNNQQCTLYLMEKLHDRDSPIVHELANGQENIVISDSLPLSEQVNLYKQLCQLKYRAEGVGGGNSGGGIFMKENSELAWLIGLHKSTQTDEYQQCTDTHSGVAVHFVLHALFCKFGKLYISGVH